MNWYWNKIDKMCPRNARGLMKFQKKQNHYIWYDILLFAPTVILCDMFLIKTDECASWLDTSCNFKVSNATEINHNMQNVVSMCQIHVSWMLASLIKH